MAVRHDSADRHLLSRRAVLGGAGAVLATAGARLPPDAAHAQTTAAETTAAQATTAQATTGVHRFTAGAAELTVLSDGALDLPPALMLPGRDRASIRALFASSGRTFTGLTSQISSAYC